MPANLEPRLVVLTGSQWGQGKTHCILDLACLLEVKGLRVGGFSLRRVYQPSPTGFELHGVEAFLLATGQSIPLARRHYRGDEVVPYRVERTEGLQMGYEDTFHLRYDGVQELLEAAQRDAASSDVDVFIFDEMGPLLMKSKVRNQKRTTAFEELALSAVEGPVPVVILVVSDVDLQARSVRRVIKTLQRDGHWDAALRVQLSDTNYHAEALGRELAALLAP